MNTTKTSQEESAATKSCVACKEQIHLNATKCPHCQSSQMPAKWKNLGTVLKWLGGITALLSIIGGMIQLNGLYQNWREQQDAIIELVKASEIQTESGDYEGAWKLVNDALMLNPGSEVARNRQVHLALEWLRTIFYSQGQHVSGKVEKLLPTLYRGVANSKSRIAADAYAHLGWADQLRYRDGKKSLNVDMHFQRALKMDDDNVYAHTMWGYWMLMPETKNIYGADRLEQSHLHFLKALESKREHDFVRTLQIRAFLETNALDKDSAQVETIKLANEMRLKNEQLALNLRLTLLESIQQAVFAGERDQGKRLPKLFYSALPANELLNTFYWLTQDMDFVYIKPAFFTAYDYKFIIARLTEEAGNLQQALSQYKRLKSQISGFTPLNAKIDKAISRVSQKIDN